MVENVLVGAYVGLLTGVFTALLVFGLSFAFKYLLGVKLPVIYAILIALGGAGLQGGIRIFVRNPDLLASSTGIVAFLIVMGMALYAHDRGQKLGKELPPKEVLLRSLRKRALSPDVVRQIGRFGQVRIRTTGEVADMEGYLPLSDDVRAAIREGEWTFPADLPITELESRLAEKLVSEHDLEDVTVSIDSDGRASVTAAPRAGRLSGKVPPGKQIVAVDTVVPHGIAEGDQVRIAVPETKINGEVVSVSADGWGGRPADAGVAEGTADAGATEGAADAEAGDGESPGGASPDTRTGESSGDDQGRVAVAVDPDDVAALVASDVTGFVVRSRGMTNEYELVSLLRRDDNGFRKLTLRPESGFVDQSISDAGLRETYGVDVLAIKRTDDWFFAPHGRTTLLAEDELFLAGRKDGLDALGEVVA